MKALRLILSSFIAIAIGLIAAVVTTAPAAASTAGGQISRSEVLSRARHWYNQDPARYDGSDTGQWLADVDGGHRYRRDCSGFVSMSLHLTSSPSSFNLSTSTYGVPVDPRDLRPGDYLTVDDGVVGDYQNGHVILFEGWAPAYPRFTYYGFGGTDGQRNGLRHRLGDFSGAATPALGGAWPQADDGGNGAGVTDGHPTSRYQAFKYKNIVDDIVAPETGPLAADGNGLRHVARGPLGDLVYRTRHNGTWNTTSLGGSIAGTPTLHSTPSGEVRVFARGTDGHLKYWAYANGAWNTVDLGGSIAGDPSAHSPASGEVRVFARGTDGRLKYWAYANGAWNTADLGGSMAGDPTAYSPASGEVRVFARGTDGQLKYWAYANGGWNTADLGGSIAGDPSAHSPASGEVRVFARGADGQLKYWAYANGAWNTADLGGSIAGDPAAVTTGDRLVHVLAADAAEQAVYYQWNGSTWSIQTLS
ncbi:hypothetical protein HII36_26740 [Nonomuraea sp. NN258]|uniref:hypothetical protein n=1 Tax=Nonomuraea antri TaxID=2730852 RepID=UPI001568B311|nr:hypothetical protein [Nonomuraea antri]NRQ35399.1 hypothetical protein [Nonomuraea antri]